MFKRLLYSSQVSEDAGNMTRHVPGNHEVMQRKSERDLLQYELPTQETGISSLIKGHKTDERFMYAAISNRPANEKGSRLSKLTRFVPSTNRTPIPEKKLPSIPLYKESETFPLSQIVSRTGKPYVLIKEVLIVFAPLVSSDSVYTTVRIAILDNRFIDDRQRPVKDFQANTNIVSKASLMLSYCFPRSEVDRIGLAISRDTAFLDEGVQWGVIQMQIAMEEMDFPIQLDNSELLAVNSMPQSLLDDRETNPNSLNITLHEGDRKKLRDMYMDGDIRDESEPLVGRNEAIKYSKSILSAPKGKRIEVHSKDWSFMNEARIQVDEADNSVEPSLDGSFDRPRTPTPPINYEDNRVGLQSPVSSLSSNLKSALKKSTRFSDESDTDRRVHVLDSSDMPVNPFN
jgi:hypothetical protein